jgi:hypothetical protein
MLEQNDEVTRDESFRRAGLFLGSGLLGVLVEAIVEGIAGGTTPGASLRPSVPFDALFSVVGGVLALRFRDVVLRTAFVVFAAEHVLRVVAAIAQKPLSPWVGNGFVGAFGVLLVLAGGRQSGSRARTWAAVVFVSAMILRFATLRYAAWLVGNRSVI